MILYIIVALLVFSVSTFFWMPLYKDAIVKRANRQLVDRALLESDGSLGGNKQLQKVLVGEGFSLDDVGKAIGASIYERQSKNIKLVPIMATLVCLAILAKILLPGFGMIVASLIGLVVIVVAVRAGMFNTKK